MPDVMNQAPNQTQQPMQQQPMQQQSMQQPRQQAQPQPKAQPAGKNGAASLLDEFKTFIARGNVLDMAVGIIIGGAFTSIVKSLVSDILMPIIGTVLAGINFNTMGIRIPWGDRPFIGIGSFIQQIIVFFITAVCVFMLVKGVNVIFKKKAAAPAKPTQEELLLTEIRDLLREKK